MSGRNFYEILNATPEASVDELRRNYKQLILQCHPDKLPHANKTSQHKSSATAANAQIDNTSTVNEFEVDAVVGADAVTTVDPKNNAALESTYTYQEFVDINEAWNTLKDAAKRRLYDAELLLTKFQTHSNIFARLTLDDMQRCAGTATNSDSDSDHEKTMSMTAAQSTSNTDNEVGTAAKSTKIYWYYTYDCRCGGQYVLDESADSEILDRMRKRRTRTRSWRRNRNHNRKQKHSLDNDNDNNCTGDGASAEAESGGNSASASANTVEGGTQDGSSVKDGNVDDDDNAHGDGDDDDNDGDVIVECSECSLVIVLT